MGKVIASASMSLDGYIAKDDNTIGRLFDWYENGEVEFPTATPDLTFHLSPASAEYWRRWVDGLGALVCGRTLFDVTDGWVAATRWTCPWWSSHTRSPRPGSRLIPRRRSTSSPRVWRRPVARAQEIAGDRIVAVTAGTIARQCLELGVLDEVSVDLVPVVMGGGRPFFGDLAVEDVLLGDPTTCIVGDRVTHLVFPVGPVS